MNKELLKEKKETIQAIKDLEIYKKELISIRKSKESKGASKYLLDRLNRDILTLEKEIETEKEYLSIKF